MSEALDVRTMNFVIDIEELDPAEGRLFGGKATGLARMARAGIPVPPAFAISTDTFRAFHAAGQRLPDGLARQLDAAIGRLGEKVGRAFGGDGAAVDPLLVSVRSGAQISMPGMMDTVLNLGLNARSAANIIARSGRRGFVIDSYLRFWKMYAEIVLGLDGEEFTEALAAARTAAEAKGGDLPALEAAIVGFIEGQGEDAPTDPRVQLDRAIAAVFGSWNSPRAKAYRDHQHIPHDLGTAVTVQAMVFGNAEGESGSGVAFSRNPNTGEAILYGEYLAGRQGEDIVSGAKTPVDLAVEDTGHDALRRALAAHSTTLEQLYRDAVDIEFTLEIGKLYLLQVRPAKRTAAAAIRIAADLVDEALLTPAEGLKRVTAEQVRRLLRPVFSPEQLASAKVIATGVGSSPGQATGIAVLDSDRAAERAASGEPVILVRPTTSPLDIRGMLAANGILTAKGGALSHAAVVSRALDRPCVVGCSTLEIDASGTGRFTIGGKQFMEGDYIAIDGAIGQVYDRKINLAAPESGSDSLEHLLSHADAQSCAQVWATATSPAAPGVAVINLSDVALARGFIDDLIAGVTRLGQGDEPEGETLTAACTAIGTAIMAGEAGARPVHVRLPQPGSSRARFLIPAWPELDQRLFLPVGNLAFQQAMLRGLDASCRASGRRLTVLLGGVTDRLEWETYRTEVMGFGTIEGGVVIQSVAGLDAAPQIAADGATVWIDLDEVIHSAHGFVQKAYISATTFDEYVGQARVQTNPRRALKPFLADMLRRAAEGEGFKGVLLGSDIEPALVGHLYRCGFRAFSAPPAQRELTRLLLGQAASEG